MNLAEALSSADAVLFIGSGVSSWSGLPSWAGMLDELADYLDRHGIDSELVRSEVRYGDLLQAASYGFDKLTRHQQADFVRLACRYGVARPSPLHRLLVTLGPRCFVTTNYDNLIEEALRLWRSTDFFRPPVTNRDLIGVPEIVQARAINFVFKPHGDAADGESIILTREQYRMLLPGGERQAALESLKLLLVSRPVIYVGFGLRDPDFLYLKDVLLNIYKGGTRDHFALMADVSVEQVDYWRRTYGIHLIPYETSVKSDGSKDHGKLMTVLEKACTSIARMDAVGKRTDATSPKTLLSLARHAAGLSRAREAVTEFTIRVSKCTRRFESRNILDSFEGAAVEQLLDSFERKIILIGLPGAGKSYALRKGAARQAEKLHAACLLANPDGATLVVPLFVDLKLYQGSIEDLVVASLPAGLDFHDLLERFVVRIFLDSYNEVSRRFVESGELETDLGKFIEAVGPAALVIGSRTLDGLEGFGFDAYELDAIEESAVVTGLRERGISLEGRFKLEMTALLQRPFYFRRILDGDVSLPDEPQPREFYRRFLERVEQSLATKLGRPVDLLRIMRPVAYQALNSGHEAFPLAILLRTIEANAPAGTKLGAHASDIANWLVSCSLLVPYSGGRIAFVHQTITEYLASLELAERFVATPELLREKLSLRRWDQALFLSLSHLQPPFDQQFFQSVLDIDLRLAIVSTKFVETGRQQLVAEMLEELIRRHDAIDKYDFVLQSAITRAFPVDESHLPQLYRLVRSDHPLRGAAANLVVALRGEAVKLEFLRLLVEFCDDYNFCANTIGPSLARFAKEDDLSTLGHWSRELEGGLRGDFVEEDFLGFTAGAAEFAKNLPLAAARLHLLPLSPDELAASPIRSALFRNIVRDRHTTEGLLSACDLILIGDRDAPLLIHFILEFARPEDHLDVQALNTSHVEALLAIFGDRPAGEDQWTWNAINSICKRRSDLRPLVEIAADKLTSLHRASLLMCAWQDQAPAFAALEALLRASDEELCDEEMAVIEQWELNWRERESLFLGLLARRNGNLSNPLLGSSSVPSLDGFGRVEISDATWWLEWMEDCLVIGDDWLVVKLAGFLGKYATDSLTRTLVAEFNDPDSKHRSLLLRYVLPNFASVTADDLSSEAASFAIDELLRSTVRGLGGGFLGRAATESFAVEKLLPLLSRVGAVEAMRVRAALDEAGQRHGRRYF